MADDGVGRRELDAGQERRVRRLVRAGWPVLQMLARTWRVRCEGREGVERMRADRQPMVMTCWHGELLPLMWHHRDEGVATLISEHRDGEIVARVAERLGFRLVRGSTSRGAGRALLGLVAMLREGHDLAVTPDGPRGPAHVYAPGAIVAAQRANAPVVPTAIAVDRAWRLRSWDRFIIPKPFARIVVVYAPPTRVAASDPRGAAEEAARFAALHAETAARAAKALAG